MGQHWTGQNPMMQCYPKESRQHCIWKNLVQCCLHTLGTILHRSKPYAMLSERFQTTFHKKKSCAILSYTLGTPLNHWSQNPTQCCLRCSRQHCTRKNLVQCCLNTLGTTFHRSKPYTILSKMLQTTLHKKKSCSMLPQYSWDNTVQVKTLCNVVQDAPDNIA